MKTTKKAPTLGAMAIFMLAVCAQLFVYQRVIRSGCCGHELQCYFPFAILIAVAQIVATVAWRKLSTREGSMLVSLAAAVIISIGTVTLAVSGTGILQWENTETTFPRETIPLAAGIPGRVVGGRADWETLRCSDQTCFVPITSEAGRWLWLSVSPADRSAGTLDELLAEDKVVVRAPRNYIVESLPGNAIPVVRVRDVPDFPRIEPLLSIGISLILGLELLHDNGMFSKFRFTV